jgi:flagellar basal body rod protein FlgB
MQNNGGQMIEPYEEQGEWNGYNWANIDSEMTKLTENNLVYRTAVEALLRKMSLLKEVIREGGR